MAKEVLKRRVRSESFFVRMHVPGKWWREAVACTSSDKVVAVICYLYHHQVVYNERPFKLRYYRLEPFRVSKWTVHRVLADFEKAGLVSITREGRQALFVEILQ